MLKEDFLAIVSTYNQQKDKGQELWSEIENQYSKPERFYHNLNHLEYIYNSLLPLKHHFDNWHTIVFAIVYHDVIYNVKEKDNEERSAMLAEARLKNLHFPEEQIKRCKELIMATKLHTRLDPEADIFTDADLSILGSDEESYKRYANQIRKEFNSFPDFLYNLGRKKVLKHFLHMDRIFKTDIFGSIYESHARKNLKAEIDSL